MKQLGKSRVAGVPTRSDINDILVFLAELFEKGLEHRTIGTHCSY